MADSPHQIAPRLAVVGAGTARAELTELARQVGAAAARKGAVVLTGGRGGVMAAASEGARSAGGVTVGILPGRSAAESPPSDAVQIPLYTGMGQARNVVVVLSAEAVIAVGGGWGTLSEIALAAKHGIPVVLLESWSMEPPADGAREMDAASVRRAASPDEAVRVALEAAGRTGHTD